MSAPVPADAAYIAYADNYAAYAGDYAAYTAYILEEMPRRHIVSGALASFSRLDSALRRLLETPESDEFGPVRPRPTSIERARSILFPVVQHGFRFPEALDVGTDHDGALRIVWENGPRLLELVVPYEHDAAAYIYYSQGDQYNLERDLAVDPLNERFDWISSS